ncbi:hypothetical protein Misp01_12640 [Microtetraspora sp. NBRC 13810]|uniref:CAP domain-containing protein n=1 Tax=Microtetraspora sp. NBRC 13810 TaxID=3030990 RepID=UPI0024A53434|nr:CAP domain-containing protein [Microtetraspora sp. NBRC 13810]GLW06134.1 hypothetical protein Misp01_12640 [Microtetraspora sp. NBRC 13810]
MRRLTRTLLCLGGLTAVGASAVPAQAAAQNGSPWRPADDCQVVAARPTATATLVYALGLRTGCADDATAVLQIRSVGVADQLVRQGRIVVRNGRFTLTAPCSPTPVTYYVAVADSARNVYRSERIQLRCTPATATRTPPAAPAASPSGWPPPQAGGSARPAAPSGVPAPAPSARRATGTAAEEEVVRLTNEARAANGCGPLAHDPQLRAAALGHSTDMAANGYFSHDSRDGRDLGDRIGATGFAPLRAWGENIAFGQPTPAAVVRAWLDSPGHRANIMNCAYTHIGVGQAGATGRPYWTQNFARH